MDQGIFSGWIGRFMNNDPSLYGARVNDEHLAGRIRAEQIGAIITATPYMLLANLVGAVVLVIALLGARQQTLALVWAAGLCGYVLYAHLRWRANKARTRRSYASTRGPRKVITNALILGLVWATLPVLFLEPGASTTQLVVVAITIGMLCCGAFALATVPSSAVAFTVPIVITSILALQLFGITHRWTVSVLLILFSSVIIRAAYAQANVFAQRVIGEYEQEKQRDMIGILLGEFEENANDWLWETDSIGRIAYVSAKFAELAKLPIENLKGKSFLRTMARGYESDPPHPAEAWQRITEHMHQRTPFRGIEMQIIAGQEQLWCHLTGKPIYDVSGQFIGFRGFCSDVTSKRADEAKIAYLARFDAVTSLPNRVYFGDTLDSRIKRLRRFNESFALHCIDLDGFKEINDTFGHAIGDAFLQEVGERVKNNIGEKDFVARLGGDEFSIIQNKVHSDFEASDFAKKIIAAISQPFSIAGNTMRAGASIGIAMAPKDGEARETLMINGDLALYRAKSDGRGVCRFYEMSMDEDARQRRLIESELRNAIANGEIQLNFHPIMDVATGRINNCEALMRWDSPRLGNVPPARFIPIAEESGLVIGIGEWLITEACRQVARWPEGTRVAINLSAVQFQNPGLLPTMMKALDEAEIEPNRIEIEITESVLLSNEEKVLAIIDTLDKLGVRLSLDNFGTGYSSLSYIRQIDFDKIKIDASFVRDMLTDRNCAAIIRAVTGLGKELGISLTAEGVETKEQLEALKSEGCSELQGYLISPILSADEYARFVRQSHDDEAGEEGLRVA